MTDEKWIGKDNIALEELGEEPLILMHRQAGIQCHDMVIDEMKNNGINANVFCESDNVSAILSLVEAGLGIAILPVSTLSVRPAEDFHAMAIAGCQLQSFSAILWKKDQTRCQLRPNCFWRCSKSFTRKFWRQLK